MNDNRTILYNALKNEGYTDIGNNQEEFNKLLENPENLRVAYDAMKGSGYTDIGDSYESFASMFSAQPQPQQRVYEASSVYRNEQGDYSQPSQAQREFESRGGFEPIGQGKVKLGETETPVFVGENGEWRVPSPVMLGREEEIFRHGNPSESEKNEFVRNEERKYRGNLASNVDAMQSNLSSLMEKQRLSDIKMHNRYKENQSAGDKIKDALMGIPTAEAPWMQGVIPSSQLDASPEGVASREANASLTAAGRKWNEAQAIIKAAKSGNFAGGLGEALSSIDTWSSDQRMRDAVEIQRVVDKWEKKGEGHLTESEKALLDAIALNAAVAEEYGDELSAAYNAGKMVGEMAPFMIEMAMNPLSGLSKKAANKIADRAVKKFGEAIGKSAAKRMAVTTAARGVGSVAGAVAGGTGMALTTGLPSVGVDVAERVTGKATYGVEDGKVKYAGNKEQEGLGTALYKSVTSRMLDNASEMVGAKYANDALKWLAKAGRGTKVLGWMDNLANSKFGKKMNEFMEKTQWHGPIEEFLEEVHVGLLNPALVGDHTLKEFFTADNLATIAIGVAVPGVAMSTLSTMAGVADGSFKAGAAERMKMQNADIEAMQLWERPEEWEDLKISLTVGSLEDIDSKLSEVYNDKALTPEQKTRAIEYAIYELQYRTARGVADAMSEGRMSGIDNMLHDVYGTAYAERVSPARANESFKAWESAGKEVTAILGLKDQSVEDWLGGRTVEEAANGDKAVLDALTAYETAKADFEGRRDRYQQDKQRAYSESDKAIDKMANNGIVYSTQLDGQPVNITGGNVVLNGNGTVDYENSSAGLYLTMPDGSVRVISSEKIPGVVLAESAEKLKANERAKIDNKWKVEFDAAEVAEAPQPSTEATQAAQQPQEGGQAPIEVQPTANNFSIEENGKVNSVEVLDESGEKARVSINGQEIEMPHEWLADARAAAGVEAQPVSSEAVAEEQPVEVAEQETVQAATPATALERVPKDENGEPIYEQVDSDTAWDAIVEQTEGDEAMAQTVADGMVADKEAALKKLEKAKSKGGVTIAEKIAAEKDRKAAIDAAKADLAKWQEIAGVAASRKAAPDINDASKTEEAVAEEVKPAESVPPVEEVQPVNEMQPVEEHPTVTAAEEGRDTVGGSPVALAYLLEGGKGSILNAGYFLHGVAAAFPAITNEIEALRNAMSGEVLGMGPMDFATQRAEEIAAISELIEGTYGEEGLNVFSELLNNADGFYPRSGQEVAARIEALQPIEEQGGEEAMPLVDNQGNPIDTNGKLVIEEVSSIDEITDEDFEAPTRNVQLPAIPENVANAIGTEGRSVIIKKNVFLKNGNTHVELEPADSRAILKSALYNPNLVGSTQPIKRPDYKVAIRTGEKNAVVVLDVFRDKEHVEIVGWRLVNEKGLAKMQRQAEREGGQFLILSPNDGAAAALSALPLGLSSDAKDTPQVSNEQENEQKSGENGNTGVKESVSAEQVSPLEQRANELAERIGVKVTVAHSIDEVTDEEAREALEAGRNIAGWYEKGTEEVVIYLPNNNTEREIDETFIHEVVAHYGLERMLGKEKFAQFLDGVWEMMPKEMQDRFSNYGNNARIKDETKRRRAAADEYVAYLAEKMELTELEQGIWDKIVQMIQQTLEAMGFQNLKQADVENMIRASYANLVKEASISQSGDQVSDQDVVYENEKTGQALFSIRTYEESGREKLAAFVDKRVKEGALTEGEGEDIVRQMDEVYEMCQKYLGVYEPFGNWSEAEVAVDESGKPVFSVIKSNGDYKMNLDFSLVCKKRRTLDAVFDEMISRGIIGEYELGQVDVAKINEIIRRFGFETACRLCFVDAKRFRVAKVADDFCNLYNNLVDMTDDQLQGVIAKEKGSTVRKKAAQLLLDEPQNRVKLSRDNFMSANGFDNMAVNKSEIMKLYNAKKGTGGPKASSGDVQYLNDIIDTNWTPEKAYEVGGVRLQSFSDYVPRMVFDYIQMVADLAAKDLPVHAYTKEPLFAKTFGLTGVKINLSLVPRVDEDGVAPGLDKDGNYAWQEGESFPYEEAMALQNAKGYKENCGTIAVGVSDAHIEKLLGDENIRMVIPYHKSGLNKQVAIFNNIDKFADYTKVQNTRDASGKRVDDASQPNFNQDIHEANDPRGAAQRYLDWCDEKGYIPKFDKFRDHPNYYKLLEDFTTIVTEGGVDNVVPQRGVTMTFPTEANAFGSLDKLIGEGLEEDAVLEGRRSEKVGEIVDTIEEEFGGNRFREKKDLKQAIAEILDPYEKEKRVQETRFRFIGEMGAANLDRAEEATTRLDNLNVAREMEEAEKDAKTIKLATGWERGADGKWRYEVMDDVKAKDEFDTFVGLSEGEEYLLSEVLTEDTYNALVLEYPQFAKVKVKAASIGEGGALWDRKNMSIVFNSNNLEMWYDGSRGYINRGLQHELQHAIQGIEGFAYGSAPSNNRHEDFYEIPSSAIRDMYDVRIEADRLIKEGEYKYLRSAIKNVFKDFYQRGWLSHKTIECFELNDEEETWGIESFVDYVAAYSSEELDDLSINEDWRSYDMYMRTAGEVEARNVVERTTMSPMARRESLAEETEDVAREDQIFIYDNLGRSEMGSHVKKRMADVAAQLKGKSLTPEQQAVVDVFSGKSDNLTVTVKTQDGVVRRIMMRQGNEANAGAKHSLYRHYGTGVGVITSDDIAMIPEIIAKGKYTQNGKRNVYELEKGGVRYTVVTEKNNRGIEVFDDFYTNKSGNARSSNTQLSAQADSITASADKGSNNSSNKQENGTLFAERYTAEEQQIIADAIANGTFMKAPNGQPTKLNEKQWAQVRTENFKKWFGDWEKATRIEKLKMSKPVEITGQEIKASEDIKEYKQNALEYGKSLRGEYTNADTGASVQVNAQSIKEVLHHDYKDVEHLQSVAAIPALIEQGVYIDTVANELKDANSKVREYQYYVCGLKIGGVDYTVKFVIAVDNNGNRYYDHKLTEIEKSKLLDELDRITSPSSQEENALSAIKDKRLLSILQTNSSKIVDENGEPMVVYHRTPKEFTSFDKEKIGSSTDWGAFGKGFYLSPADFGSIYGENLMSLFVNVKNPLVLNDANAFDVKQPFFSKDYSWRREQSENFTEWVKDSGYDGVWYIEGTGRDEIVAFEPNQMKSASDNTGDFSGNENDIRFRERDDVASEEGKETIDDIPTRPMTLMERVKASLLEASAKNKENLKLRRDALRNLGQDLANVLKLMRAQRKYDKSTVETLRVIAKMYFKDAQLLDKLTPYEVTRIMSLLKRSVGKGYRFDEASKLLDILFNAHNKALAEVLAQTEKVKAKKVNAAGVEVMGRLDKYGQELVETYRGAKDLDMERIDEMIAESNNELNDAREGVRSAFGLTEADDVDAIVKDFDSADKVKSDAVDAYMRERARYEGLRLAKEYRETILTSKGEISELKKELRDIEAKFRRGEVDGKLFHELRDALWMNILEADAEVIDGYHSVIGALAHDVRESSLRAKAFVQAQIDRAQEIQHDANSDMQGRNADVQGTHPDKWNNSAVRAVMSAMPTFQTMLMKFGEQAVDGKGYLYNRFMPQVTMAADNEFRGRVAAREAIEAKLKDIYGDKKMDIGRFMDLSRKDGVSVMYIEGKEMKEFKLTKGQMLYIYMVDKMTDGEMKLRKMGITEDAVAEIAKNLDEQMIQFADWMQGEFLTDLRTKYNAVHERMFGAPMAAIENYFPLKIKKEARGEKGDVSQQNSEDKPSTVTGSIIKRTKNTTALDLSADAMSVLLEHIDNMEHWAAFAEFNRDLNTLLNYRRFQNQVKNMTTLRYGSGDVLWRNFKDVAAVAAGEYRPTKSEFDKALLNIAKGVTVAKINFRFYTAAKQILSAPAFWTGAAPQYFAKCYTNPKGSWNWAIDNLPGFKERWESRAMGNEKLLEDESDWKVWRNKFVAGATRWGMSANAAVDALTVAMGARAVYLDKYNELKKAGYNEQKADEKARQTAAEAYNESQQSSESAYLSPLQKSGTVVSAIFTTFKNSNFGYTRKTAQAIANIVRKTKGDKEKTIAFMAKQMARDGLTPAQAKAYATKLYNRSLWKDYADAALFGFGLQLLWELGGAAIYLIGGDDDEKKDAMMQEAAVRATMGTLQGLPLGETAANAVMAVMAGDAEKFRLPELVAVGDIRNVAQAMDTDAVRGATEVVNMLISIGIGVTPQVLTDILVACNELGKSPEEFGTFLLRFMNAPQSQLEALTIDKAMEEFAKNSVEVGKEYVEYRMDKNVPYFQWLYSDEGEQKAIERYAKRFDKLLDERLDFVVEDATAYDTFYNGSNPEMKKTLSEKRQGYLAGDEAAEFVKRDTKAIVEETLYGKRDINTAYFEMSTAEDEDMEFLIKKARKNLEGKAEATVAQKSLLKRINSNNNAINKLKRAMQTDPTNKVKYMERIRAIRTKLVDLINNSDE